MTEPNYKELYFNLYKKYGSTVSEITLLTSLVKPMLNNETIVNEIPFPQKAALMSYFNVEFDNNKVTIDSDSDKESSDDHQ